MNTETPDNVIPFPAGGRRRQRVPHKVRRKLRKLAMQRDSRVCVRHARDMLVELWAEPNGSNPPKHIGFVCLACGTVFTAKSTVSAPNIEAMRIPGAKGRASKAHAARLRAVDRLGVALIGERAIHRALEATAVTEDAA